MSLTTVIQLLFALSALIVLHEIGHFAAARLFKVDVEEFGLGYPPRALTLFEINGTKYTLNWLPLGGFVRLKGEITEEDDPGSLQTATPWARLGIFAAGPIMNILAAVILYTIIITQIGGPDLTKVLVAGVAQDSPAAQAGLQPGDIITHANGEEVNSTDELHNIIYAHLGETIRLTFVRGEAVNEISLIPRDPPPAEGAIGIGMTNPTQPISTIEAIPLGVRAAYENTLLLLTLPGDLIRGAIEPEAARPVGIKGMIDVYEYVSEQDSPVEDAPININAVGFFAWISLTLGVLNLLPIPALDGGRILFILPEIVLRRRISMQWQSILITISFTALVALMLYINLLDFINPIQLPQ